MQAAEKRDFMRMEYCQELINKKRVSETISKVSYLEIVSV